MIERLIYFSGKERYDVNLADGYAEIVCVRTSEVVSKIRVGMLEDRDVVDAVRYTVACHENP